MLAHLVENRKKEAKENPNSQRNPHSTFGNGVITLYNSAVLSGVLLDSNSRRELSKPSQN